MKTLREYINIISEASESLSPETIKKITQLVNKLGLPDEVSAGRVGWTESITRDYDGEIVGSEYSRGVATCSTEDFDDLNRVLEIVLEFTNNSIDNIEISEPDDQYAPRYDVDIDRDAIEQAMISSGYSEEKAQDEDEQNDFFSFATNGELDDDEETWHLSDHVAILVWSDIKVSVKKGIVDPQEFETAMGNADNTDYRFSGE